MNEATKKLYTAAFFTTCYACILFVFTLIFLGASYLFQDQQEVMTSVENEVQEYSLSDAFDNRITTLP